MDGLTVLKATGCDLRRLPLDARGAFFLSQLDGQLSLEEIAAVAGVEMGEAIELARQLVELGAVATVNRPAPRPGISLSPKRPAGIVERRGSAQRHDPRAEGAIDERPPSSRRRPSRRSHRALAAARAATRTESAAAKPSAPPVEEALVAEIVAVDAKLGAVDHYALLGLEPSATKKEIKRAYFALAAKYHPDRFFGRDLGTARAPLERIFARITVAHDTLADPARRTAYDGTLPKPAAPVAPSRSPAPSMPPPARVSVPPVAPSVPPAPSMPPPARASVPPVAPSVPPASAPTGSATASPDRIRQLRAAAMELKVQANVDLLVTAAEEALRAEDFVSAANNYRLALSHRDDPMLRMKFEDVDARARIIRFEKNIGPARSAEREHRWAEAAHFYERAHEARPDADVAARAANALRLSGGDLSRAAALATDAVRLEGKTLSHRITLVEVQLAAARLADAEEACEGAFAIAPKDARLKELAAAIAKRRKGA